MQLYNKNRIVIVAPNDGTDVRIGKVCRSIARLGFDTHFIGWDRRPEGGKSKDLGLCNTHIVELATAYGRSSLSGYIRFTWHIAGCLQKLRPETICCVDEQMALIALPMRYFLYRNLVCDVFDPLYDRHTHLNWMTRAALKTLQNISRLGSDRLIATDRARYETFGIFRDKTIVIENYPEDPGESLAKTPLDGPIRVYAAGSLSARRGLKQLIAVVDTMSNVEIVSAGWLYDEYSNEVFAKHKKVTFHGVVTAHESLRLAGRCDAIFSFYEPSSLNNRQASPNKVYDAMSVGRPVIINEETTISQWVVDMNLGLRCPYYDIEGLQIAIESLTERRKSITDFSRHTREVFSQGYSWGNIEPRLNNLYRSLL